MPISFATSLDSLHNASRLGPVEWAIFFSAVTLRIAIRIGLWTVPYRFWKRTFETAFAEPRFASSEKVRHLVRTALSRSDRLLTPGGMCLSRALAGYMLLRFLRADGQIRLAVGWSADGKSLQSHAWLESSGEPLVGDPGTGLKRLTKASAA